MARTIAGKAAQGGPEFGPLEPLVARLRSAARRCAGDDVCEVTTERTNFLWIYGTTLVEAEPAADGSVIVRAFLVMGPRRDAALVDRVRAFQKPPLGRLVVDDDGDIALEHRIPPGVTELALEDALCEVSRQADRLDDLLCARFGGVRFYDRFRRDVLDALVAEA